MIKNFFYNCYLILFITGINFLNANQMNKTIMESVSKNKKFIIIAGGPFKENLIKKHIKEDCYIIALDGASVHLLQNNIIPHYIVGDFDSLKDCLEKNNLSSYEKEKVFESLFKAIEYFDLIGKPEKLTFEEYRFENLIFIRSYCQMYTDLDKGVEFALKQNASSVKILYALGGDRTDHSFHNLSVLKKFHRMSLNSEIYHKATIEIETEKEIIRYLEKGEKYEFMGTCGAKLGLFGFPEAKVKTEGLSWELDETYPLILGKQDSSSNELKSKHIKISVLEGEVLVIRPNY